MHHRQRRHDLVAALARTTSGKRRRLTLVHAVTLKPLRAFHSYAACPDLPDRLVSVSQVTFKATGMA
jgi:hypothetical protein